MKNNCRNCHFLIKASQNGSFLWNETERETESIPAFYVASCYMSVWDTGIDPSLNEKLSKIINENREDSCFFRKYYHGMNLKAAKVLQEREAAYAKFERSFKNAKLGIWIAALALVSNIIITIISSLQ